MSRTTKVTLTASAVTLLCLGASLSISPQVLAETLGREVQSFAPLDPSTYPGQTQQPRALDASTAPRHHSTMSRDDDIWTTSQPPVAQPSEPFAEHPESPTLGAAGSADPDNTAPNPRSTSREFSEVSPPNPASPGTPDNSPAVTDDTASDTAEIAPPDLDSPDSLTVIVNKLRPLPEDYVPEDLVELPAEFGDDDTYQVRAEAADATRALFEAAEQDGIDLTVVSAYRSYEYQQELYAGYVAQHGNELTDEMSAQPGHSEHQTGLAIDVDTPDGQHTLRQSFGQTEAGQWLVEHAHDHGFVIRYPQDAHEVTGFHYEPWHLRYFGQEYAQAIMDDTGVAETTFELDPAPDYAP